MTPKFPLEIVVVFNGQDTLESAFLQSAGLDEATLTLIDNRGRGVGLPTLFNERRQRSTAEWLVFCHQDFVVFDADWIHRILALPPTACYGPIGRDATLRWRGADLWRARPVRSRLARPDDAEGSAIDVSVVTPCYEQGTLLVEAIASVERAAPPNCELIIVNDGSRQLRTLEVLDTLKRLGYYVRDQANLGLSAARNAGITLARGRYILPLDDDDRLRAGFIQDAIQVLDSRPDVGVVYGDRHDFGLSSGDRAIAEFDKGRLLEANYIDACAVFRRDIWVECGGYDASVSPLEDWELWIQTTKRGWRFCHLAKVTFDYRVRPDSLLARVAASKALEAELHNRIKAKHEDVYRSLGLAAEGAGAPAK